MGDVQDGDEQYPAGDRPDPLRGAEFGRAKAGDFLVAMGSGDQQAV